MARGFAQFYIALNHGFEHQFLKMSAYLIVYLVCKSQSGVIHCEQEAFDFERRVQFFFIIFIVLSSLLIPSSAKYSHCTGIITLSEATSEFTVIRPSDGLQSIRI